jgi:hypothetical protein
LDFEERKMKQIKATTAGGLLSCLGAFAIAVLVMAGIFTGLRNKYSGQT